VTGFGAGVGLLLDSKGPQVRQGASGSRRRRHEPGMGDAGLGGSLHKGLSIGEDDILGPCFQETGGGLFQAATMGSAAWRTAFPEFINCLLPAVIPTRGVVWESEL